MVSSGIHSLITKGNISNDENKDITHTRSFESTLFNECFINISFIEFTNERSTQAIKKYIYLNYFRNSQIIYKLPKTTYKLCLFLSDSLMIFSFVFNGNLSLYLVKSSSILFFISTKI
ncbi:hypothetical protein HOG27_03320 [bacterium]|nr:hypothetical protein [bacterium]